MKNDLTAEEWAVLNDYLQYGVAFVGSKDYEKRMELWKSAKDKVKKVAEEIKRG